jgi:predicted nucleotidyltransferase
MRIYTKEVKLGIKKFCKNVIKILNPECIILYGSLAKGEFNERSDVDIIVISSKLPENPYQRSVLLYEMVKTLDPIEPLGFTPEEFINMIKKRHCTSLFAMQEGKPLFKKKYFFYLKKIHEEILFKYKISKSIASWVPETLN